MDYLRRLAIHAAQRKGYRLTMEPKELRQTGLVSGQEDEACGKLEGEELQSTSGFHALMDSKNRMNLHVYELLVKFSQLQDAGNYLL